MTSSSHWKSLNEGLCLELKSNSADLNIPAKSLSIVWGNDRRYWEWTDISQETRWEGFREGAVLHQVNWLEVVGSLKVASSVDIPTICEIYYIIKFRVDAFGWDSVPVEFKRNVGGEETETTVDLEPYTRNNDTWHEIYGCEFTVPARQTVSLSFGMLENKSEWWKGGMILAGVKIRPKIDGAKAKEKMGSSKP